MAKQTESSPLDLTTKRNIDRFEYKKRFEEAVSDAQYLIIYASSNCPTDINTQILDILGEKIQKDTRAATYVNQFFTALQSETVGRGPFSGMGGSDQVLEQRVWKRRGEYPP